MQCNAWIYIDLPIETFGVSFTTSTVGTSGNKDETSKLGWQERLAKIHWLVLQCRPGTQGMEAIKEALSTFTPLRVLWLIYYKGRRSRYSGDSGLVTTVWLPVEDLWHARAGPPIRAKILKFVFVFCVLFVFIYQYTYICSNRIVKRKHCTCFCGSVFQGTDISTNNACNKCLLKRQPCVEILQSVLFSPRLFLKYHLLLFLELLCSSSSDVDEKDPSFSAASSSETATTK